GDGQLDLLGRLQIDDELELLRLFHPANRQAWHPSRLAPVIELAQRYSFFAATTLGVTDANHVFRLRQCTETAASAIRKGVYRQLGFPPAVSTASPILLEHPRFASC